MEDQLGLHRCRSPNKPGSDDSFAHNHLGGNTLNLKAIFSDETVDYKTPYQCNPGDDVTLRVRTGKGDMDVVKVNLNGRIKVMSKTQTEGCFDYYTYTFRCGKENVRYYYSLTKGKETVYCHRLGVVSWLEERHSFSINPGFHVPEWALGTVYYQIYTDRFRNGNPKNDVKTNEYFYADHHVRQVKDWDSIPEKLDVGRFYGGDLQGVLEKLDYIQSLGVETIYFNPLFISPSNHKYDTQDYDHIDPHLAVIEDDLEHPMQDWEKHNGYAPQYITRVTSAANLEKSNAFFAQLVKEIHRRGMRVILDGVFNHCGSFNKWMDREGIYVSKSDFRKGAFQSTDSPYRSYFRFKGKDSYEGWWDFVTLPKLNYEGSPALVSAIMDIGKKWVSEPFCVDGWRLDVGADLGHSEDYNHKFWKQFRQSVRSANPEAVILAEHYGSAESWLDGSQWDTVMNYDAFMDPVSWFLTGVEKHSDSSDGRKWLDGDLFFKSMLEAMSRFPRPSLDSAMNELSNHDHSRFLTRTNRKVGRLATAGAKAAGEDVQIPIMKLGVLMQMTWPGSPGIYYGDEAGQVGWTDPDNRRTYPWGKENKELIAFHQDASRLHREIPCLRLGSVKPLCSGSGYVVYGRFDAGSQAVIAINAGASDETLEIPVWETGIPKGTALQTVFSTGKAVSGTEKDGVYTVTIPAQTGCVFIPDMKGIRKETEK